MPRTNHSPPSPLPDGVTAAAAQRESRADRLQNALGVLADGLVDGLFRGELDALLASATEPAGAAREEVSRGAR